MAKKKSVIAIQEMGKEKLTEVVNLITKTCEHVGVEYNVMAGKNGNAREIEIFGNSKQVFQVAEATALWGKENG